MRKSQSHGLGLDNLLRLLTPLMKNELSYSDLRVHSNIKMRKSFNAYLRFCIYRYFITKNRHESKMIYSLTPVGKNFIGLVMPYDDFEINTFMIVSK